MNKSFSFNEVNHFGSDLEKELLSQTSDRLARQYEEEKLNRWRIRYPIILFGLLGISLSAYFASYQNWISFNQKKSEKEEREYNACLALRKIYVAQEVYRNVVEKSSKNADHLYSFNIDELIEKGFLGRPFVLAMESSGYQFYLFPKKGRKDGFYALAKPPFLRSKQGSAMHLKSFYIDETGVLRWAKGDGEPNSRSPKVPWKAIPLK
ncbi:MAG: hypothetical protein D6785_16515 [Planctomycetota bacterium]|nr:MAG: hypothetical protein D6785_16515 [Planctomycetota bacterium]